jgi:ribonuclease HII
MGIDEAGRGPLAGPVVAAAAIVPTDLPGVVDSKQITDEEDRERAYAAIVESPGARWAVAVVDASTIDEINILQATLLGMRMAAIALFSDDAVGHPIVAAPCVSIPGCYVARGFTDHQGRPRTERFEGSRLIPDQVYALVDGNRLPQQMPCRAEPVVKGDSKEYSIAAASILAKVTRDRLMRGFSDLYPAYELAQHKGYPTAAHVAAIRLHGACPIHRRSFAPLKHMDLDERSMGTKTFSAAKSSSSSKRGRCRRAAGPSRV